MRTPTRLSRSTQKVRRTVAGGKRPDGLRRGRPRVRPDPAQLRLVATDEPLTAVAGLVPLAQYLARLGVDRALHAAFDRLKPVGPVVYAMGDVVRLLLDATFAGATRVFGLEALAADPVFVHLAGGAVPSLDVVYDDLTRFDDDALDALTAMVVAHGCARLARRRWGRIHVDLDTTVEELFGLQEGARPGPNPRYRGRPSYHPLVARVAEVNAIVGARLRPGDTSFGADDAPWACAVVRAVRAAVGPDCVIVVRIDAAGDCTAVLRALSAEGVHVVTKASLDPELLDEIAWVPERAWRTVDRDADGRPSRQVAEIPYRRPAWRRAGVAYRLVAVRTNDRVTGKAHAVWADSEWTVQAFVTTAWDWDGDEVAHTYDGRAGIEPCLGELKGAWGLGKVPTHDFAANAALFLIKLLAFNLMRRYVSARHPALAAWRMPWLRRVLIVVAGRLAHHARRWHVAVPRSCAIARRLN